MNEIQTEVIFLNLLRQCDEFVVSIVGTVPPVDAGSFRARLLSLFATFNANKAGFIESVFALGLLVSLLKEYAAFEMQNIESIGTPETISAVQAWEDIQNKPATFPPDAHEHNWSEINYKPYRYDPKVHRHPWEQIDNIPATFAPGTHAHAFADITSKPTTYPPDAHAHAFADITSKPATYPPDAHAHAFADITSKPATYPPDAHAHAFADITSKPATYPPDAHAHAFADITSKPATYPPDVHAHTFSEITLKPDVYPATWNGIESKPANMKVISSVSWTGDGTTSQVVSTPFQVQLMQIIAVNGLTGVVTSGGAIRTTATTITGAVTYGALSMTLNVAALTASGIGYTAIIYGAI